jgi:NADPH:quinone reductase-like Zn-dependent oxidoreductase
MHKDTLPESKIEIEPRAFGINFREVLIALGQLEEGDLSFEECAGVVTQIGHEAAIKTGLRLGDRVCGWSQGSSGPKIQVDWHAVVPFSDSLTFEEAASVPMVWTTVYYSLRSIAALTKDETILIHAGSGGVGQAAIMLSQYMGAEIYTTVSSVEKRDFLIRKYGVAPDRIYYSRDSSFAAAVMTATEGRGVDVVLNSLAGPLLEESWNCVAPFGRFIEIGKKDIHSAKLLSMSKFRRNVAFAAVDLVELLLYKPLKMREVINEVLQLIDSETLSTVSPINTFSATKVQDAFRYMQTGRHIGKVVVTVEPKMEIHVSTSFAHGSIPATLLTLVDYAQNGSNHIEFSQ